MRERAMWDRICEAREWRVRDLHWNEAGWPKTDCCGT